MSYRIFKPWYTDRQTKERRESPNYQIIFRDHKMRRLSFTGKPRREETEGIAQHLTTMISARRTGGELDGRAKKWFGNLPAASRKRLVDMDLIDPVELSADIPLIDHLEGQRDEAGKIIRPGFKQAMEARGAIASHVGPKISRIKSILTGVGFTFWRELILPGAESQITVWLGQKRADKEISGTTFNYYIRDLKSFTRWLDGDGRVPSFALAGMKGVDNADMDAKRRRPLSVDEMHWLVTVTAQGPMRQCLTGEERALLYRFAFETGIRPRQIRALKVSSFDLKADPATVTSEAVWVKRRRVHTQVMRPALAGELAKLFESKFPDAIAIKMPKSPFHLANMLRADLEAARLEWINAGQTDEEKIERAKSDFLAEKNRQGEKAVFYSTRHGHGTALGNAGVPEKDIAASMHHSSRKTTARYLHSDQKAVANAIAALPDLSYPMAQIATGTDCFNNALTGKNFSVESGGVGSKKRRREDVAESLEKTGETAISDEKLKSGLLAELADALDSKSNARKGVSVRLR